MRQVAKKFHFKGHLKISRPIPTSYVMHLSVTDCDWNVSSVSVSSLSFLMCATQKAVGHNLYIPAESISRTSRDQSCVFVHSQNEYNAVVLFVRRGLPTLR